MLAKYQLQVQRLLQNPPAPTPLYDPQTIIDAINMARSQLAGESKCVRFLGTISTVLAVRNYNFTALNTGVSSANGIQGALNVRAILYTIASGMRWIRPRPWEWFMLFKMNNPVPPSGAPQVWSQFSQGETGNFYIDPLPNQVYFLTCDCECQPIPLVDDTTVEAIPPLWQDAVQFFAAFFVLLSAQSGARTADANRMYERYEEFVNRARRFATPGVNPGLYEQTQDPTMGNKLGIQRSSGGGG